MKGFYVSFLAVVAGLSCITVPLGAQEAGGEVRFRAALILADLNVRPIPQLRLIVFGPDGNRVREISTTLDGVATLRLPAGQRRFDSWDLGLEGILRLECSPKTSL
jgi:hypothetical protein